jgi:hypothetical protein
LFSELLDYQETFNNQHKDPIYLGSFRKEFYLPEIWEDIKEKQEESQHYEKILCTERPNRSNHLSDDPKEN